VIGALFAPASPSRKNAGIVQYRVFVKSQHNLAADGTDEGPDIGELRHPSECDPDLGC